MPNRKRLVLDCLDKRILIELSWHIMVFRFFFERVFLNFAIAAGMQVSLHPRAI